VLLHVLKRTYRFGAFEVEVVDPVADYVKVLQAVFDFPLIKKLVTRPDFKFKFDAMHAVTGAYAKPIFVDLLGAPLDSIKDGVPSEDFNGGHPDPNLTYAEVCGFLFLIFSFLFFSFVEKRLIRTDIENEIPERSLPTSMSSILLFPIYRSW
jgi:phosphoglucomutase